LLASAAASLLLGIACGSFSGTDAKQNATDEDSGGDDGGDTVDGATANDAAVSGAVDAGGATIDGGATFSCTKFPTAFVCADFDEHMANFYEGTTSVPIGNVPDGSIAPPFVSPPAAFWSLGMPRIVANATSNLTFVDATFALRFDNPKSGSASFAEIEISGCDISFEQATGGDRLNLKTTCGNEAGAQQATILSTLPSADIWYQAQLTVDFAKSTATAVFDGHKATINLSPYFTAGGMVRVQVGASANVNRIGFDNVLVLAH